MTVNHPSPGGASAGKPAKRLRMVGLVVLLLGLAAAGIVYWLGMHGGPAEDELLAGNAKVESHQMGVLYGKMGLLTDKLADDLKQPGIQAGLIATASIVIALGCFYLARLSDEDDTAR